MNKLIFLISFLFIVSISTIAENTNNINQVNLDTAIVEILSGIKTVGGEVYNSSKSMVSNTLDLVSKEAPELINQFLLWEFINDIIVTLIGLIVSILCVYIPYKFKFDLDAFMISIIISVISIVVSLIFGLDALKIKIAPKIYLIEYIVKHINNK